MTEGALEGLNTQHLIGNLEVDVSGVSAAVRASSILFHSLDQRAFNTHARYQFGMTRTRDRGWLISSIKPTVLWNEGDSAIHSGAELRIIPREQGSQSSSSNQGF